MGTSKKLFIGFITLIEDLMDPSEKLFIGFIIFIVAILVVLIITSIMNSSGITEGEIYEKHYEPESTTLIMMPVTISTGKTSTTIMQPMFIFDDEDYIIKIRKFDDKEGEFLTRTIWLAPEIYNKVSVGDYFVYDKEFCETIDPDIKKRQE